MSKRKERSFADWLRLLRIANRPTRYLPFSEEKIRVMKLRAAFRLPLFVPGDVIPDDEELIGAEAAARRSPLAG